MVHRPIIFGEHLKLFFTEIRCIDNMTLLVLRSHLALEYMLNEIIRHYFKNSEKIFDIDSVIGFENKLKIVEATEILDDFKEKKRSFSGSEDLLYNLRKINEIRNRYAHTFYTEDMKREIGLKISQLKNEGNKASADDLSILKGAVLITHRDLIYILDKVSEKSKWRKATYLTGDNKKEKSH